MTRFSTEEVYDWLTIGPKRLSGTLQDYRWEGPWPKCEMWSQ